MVCDTCKERDAVVHLTQIVDGAVSQIHLCEKCAAEKGVETSVAAPKPPLGEFLQAVQQQLAVTPNESGRCSFCSATLRDFRSSGRVGCARCYITFESSMRDLLRRVHGHSRHVGRRYQPPHPGQMERANILIELRDKLRRAIESEQFELAADIRDRIREHE